jgi:hypothetical protein
MPALAVDSCSLDGVYITSAAVDFPPGDQFIGSFAFTSPGVCNQAGMVTVTGSFMAMGFPVLQGLPGVFTAPYTVDGMGILFISSSFGSITGRVGHLSGNLANSFVFISSSGDLRFSGVAVRQDLVDGDGGGSTGAMVVTGAPFPALTPAQGQAVGPSTATCPVGKVILGGGGNVTTATSGIGRGVLSQSAPVGSTMWSATAIVANASLLDGTVTVTAFAICGDP